MYGTKVINPYLGFQNTSKDTLAVKPNKRCGNRAVRDPTYQHELCRFFLNETVFYCMIRVCEGDVIFLDCACFKV